MDLYLMLGIGAAIAGYILSYVAYHYIETRDVEKDDVTKEAIGNIHLRSALIAGLSAFVAMFFINKNKGGNVMGSMSVQKMDVGQPSF
jgi:H+/Cl- antiporter ClcA